MRKYRIFVMCDVEAEDEGEALRAALYKIELDQFNWRSERIGGLYEGKRR